jgi:hypothetical protein
MSKTARFGVLSISRKALICLSVQFLLWYWVHFVLGKPMLRTNFVGGAIVKIRFDYHLLMASTRILENSEGGPWQKKSTYTILTPISDDH